STPAETTAPSTPAETTAPSTPAETTAPSTPAETTAPSTPAETTAPSTPAETTAPTVKPTQPSNPATGDNSHLVVWMGLMAAATAAFVSIFVFGKKKIAR
ncbi:MAG: LPXTG cell wall anchor domain-containing protein, partial [Oscillospiraceae bacterium]|nr:LPXTG cell wall anchor domain-containing protein [Oscillospiraceae bacterium]